MNKSLIYRYLLALAYLAVFALRVTSAAANTLTVTNTGDSGAGSLRQALRDANTTGASLIRFNIPTRDAGFSAATGTFTIHLSSALPALTANGITLDGSTQTAFSGNTNAGGPEVTLSGSVGVSDGLVIRASNCRIRGLVVSGFPNSGISLTGPGATANRVEGCFVGTDARGTTAAPNFNGILISGGAHSNLIGGTTPTTRNVLAGNKNDGVHISDNGTNNNIIEGNYIGTNGTGIRALPNGASGIAVVLGGKNNLVGGVTPGARNLISSNIAFDIYLNGIGTNNNQIQGNYIGLNATGALALTTNNIGIAIGGGATGNVVGGTAGGTRNVISGHSGAGVIVWYSAKGNVVQGNYIGTDATGTRLQRNANGVVISNGAQSNLVGGVVPGTRNIISGNGVGVWLNNTNTSANQVQGNYIGLNASGSTALPNTMGILVSNGTSNNTIGGTTAGARNVISGNAADGVHITDTGTTNNKAQGNYIGTNLTGTVALPNRASGVAIVAGAQSNIIGGSLTGARNLISGNGYGIYIGGSNSNQVQGNYIGTNITGTMVLPNDYGIALAGGAKQNMVGGTTLGTRNVISGNRHHGVLIGNPGTDSNIVQGNYMGTDTSGSKALPNGDSGIGIIGGQYNLVGGLVPAARNVISGNVANGVFIGFVGANNNVVQGNYLGTDASGTIALLGGKYANGVALMYGASSNIIGGAAPGTRNIIAGNQASGVYIDGNNTVANRVQGNFVGTMPNGQRALPNGVGIYMSGGTHDNIIGGTATGAGNTISGNRQDGISIIPNDPNSTNNNQVQGNVVSRNRGSGVRIIGHNTGNSIRHNSIFGNGGLGINLQPDGEPDNTVTPNDPGDADTGPNNLQNFPVLTSVTDTSGSTVISGTLNSTPNSSFDVDYYGNNTADPSGYGEGEIYLGTTRISTNSSGVSTFSISSSRSGIRQFFTATATNAHTGDTSEFSQAAQVTPATALALMRQTSRVVLSTAALHSAQSSIELDFSNALDSTTATAIEHYTVTVNGQPAVVQSVAYTAARHRVTLGLAEGSLPSGAAVVIAWQDLQDKQSRSCSGRLGPFIAP